VQANTSMGTTGLSQIPMAEPPQTELISQLMGCVHGL
jgi:hypothetical protein